MSLDWNLTKIADYKSLCWKADPTPDNPDQSRLNPVTEALIWATMATDIGEITEANVREFYLRVYAWEHARGAFSIGPDGADHYITPQDVREHIGLSTNVFPKTTDAKYARKILDGLMRDAGDAWKRAEQAAQTV